MKIVVGTHNEHKVAELRRILGPLLPGVELVAYDGPDPIEDGDTFEANALIKARAAAAHTGRGRDRRRLGDRGRCAGWRPRHPLGAVCRHEGRHGQRAEAARRPRGRG